MSNTSKKLKKDLGYEEKALKIIKEGDVNSWNRLQVELRTKLYEDIIAWKLENENIDIGPNKAQEFINLHESFIFFSLLGFESGKPGFDIQLKIIDEIVDPPGWQFHGSVRLIELPIVTVFIYQALFGAVCMYTGRILPAIRMAEKTIVTHETFNYGKGKKIWNAFCIAEGTWDVLINRFIAWSGLQQIFGDQEIFEASLCGYYCMLNTLEFCERITPIPNKDLGGYPEVQLYAFNCKIENKRRGYNMLLRNSHEILKYFEAKSINCEIFKKHWQEWAGNMNAIVNRNLGFSGRKIPHTNLVQDLFNE